MSLKVIKPIDITDDIMASSVSEPDTSQGESIWIDLFDDYYTTLSNTDDNYYTIASSGTVDYVFRSTTSLSLVIDVYENAALTSSNSMGTSRALGVTYGAEGIISVNDSSIDPFRLYDISDFSDYQVSSSGQPATSEYLAICEIDDVYYLYDYVNDNVDSYSYSSLTFTYIETVATSVGLGKYCTFTPTDKGGIKVLSGNVVYTYDTSFTLLSTKTLSDMNDELTWASGISNNGDGFNILSVLDGVITKYESDLSFSGGYSSGDQVISADTHLIYQSAIGNNFDEPIVGAALTVPSWVEVSATNKYKAFDYVINTKSAMASTTLNQAQIILTPGQVVTNVAIFGLENVTNVNVRVFEDDASGTLIYPYTGSGSATKYLEIDAPDGDLVANDAYLGDKVIYDDLPTYANPYIIIIFRSDDDELEVGDVVIGNSRTLGVALYESNTSRTSYDTVDTDDFGNETITNRPSAEYTSFEVAVFPEYANYVERILKESLNKPRVWVAAKPDNEKLFTFGYYERSPITYSSPSKYDTTLKVRGLV